MKRRKIPKSTASQGSRSGVKSPNPRRRAASPSQTGGFSSSFSDELRLGRWTCYHGKEEEKPWLPLADKFSESIREYVAEAARRLPLEEIPELLHCVGAVGYCFGLADPVTNIILNAIAHLASDDLEEHLPPLPPPKRRTRNRNTDSGWGYISMMSFQGLLAFMKVYFRYLTKNQAKHYLYLASYDLLLAIELVHHDRRRCLPRPSMLLDDGRMKTALRIAAVQARHPTPDDLVQTMTAQYPSHLLSPIMDKLRGSELLTPHDVRAIMDLLLVRQCLPANMNLLCCPNGDACAHPATNNGGTLQVTICIGGGSFARISTEIVTPNHVQPQQLRYISDLTFDDSSAMETKLSKCSSGGCQVDYDFDKFSPCEYILSLKMCLLDAIHGFYIRALAMLPLPRGDDDNDSMRRGRLLRALIVSGHCYGPLDPVSNIILNAVLYNAMYEGDSEGELPHDIFDTHAMQDMASCSLDGLVALLCDITATATGAPLSKHEAVEYLWSRQCDLTEKLQQTVMTKKKNPYAAAAKASKHPQHAMLGLLLVSFSGEKLDRLRYLLRSISDGSGCVISSDDWEQVNTMIKKELTAMIARKELLPFDPQALSASSRVSASVILQSLARNKLEELLLRYSRQHPWEPRYKLDLICGLEEPKSPRCRCYHANFLASTDGSVFKLNGETTIAPTTVRRLFFAEFWDSQYGRFCESRAKPMCCLVQDSSPCFGGCIFCDEASTIVHPPCAARSHLDDDDDDPFIDYNVKAAIRMWFPKEL